MKKTFVYVIIIIIFCRKEEQFSQITNKGEENEER